MMNFNYYGKRENTVYPIEPGKEWDENNSGADLFFTPQIFDGAGNRKKENLVGIRFVCADFDNVDETSFAKKMKWYPTASRIVRTRSGVHAYWMLEEVIPASESAIEQYRNFVGTRLVPLGADANAKDVSRILRVPRSRYWRDSKGNFYGEQELRCEVVYDSAKTYDLEYLSRKFPAVIPREETVRVEAPQTVARAGGSFWTKANALDPRRTIEVLSGTDWVRGEKFTFKPDSGVTRILVDGKPSNAWIDKAGRIGSTVKAGPAIPNWLAYYGWDFAKVAEILKTYFPNLEEK